ncbi:MAG TPA: hypothetical protein VK253_02360 [Candidatus Binatia bacterium]|nr:hypothetical protein [Candidatus Binatia bacterium]
MTNQIQDRTSTEANWQLFLRKHWVAFAVLVAAAALAAAGAVYVFVWFTGNAQSTGLVPSTLGLWTMGNTILFILHAIFWELVLIGIPAAIGAVIGWQWWKRLPDAHEYHLSGKRGRSRGASGAISPLLFIAFALKVYVDGNWNVAISTYTLNYVVGSMVTILLWIVAIFAIPAIVGLVWWIRHEMNKKP